MGCGIEEKLSIVIITYNRSKLLTNTLESFVESPFFKCSFTVLNNCSTDNTLDVCQQYQKLFPNLKIKTNEFNIGGDANILRACEIADKDYLWILADDDKYDFTHCDDVINAICKDKVDLLHVGAHSNIEWSHSGELMKVRELVESGYPFFRFSSFLPCNIFRIETIYPFIIDGYRNIHNMYPHMPYLFSYYTNNKEIYIAKKRVVIAIIGHQEYNYYSFLKSWMNTSFLLKNKDDISKCFYDQFREYGRLHIFLIFFFRAIFQKEFPMNFIYRMWILFDRKDKINCTFLFFSYLFNKIKKRFGRIFK